MVISGKIKDLCINSVPYQEIHYYITNIALITGLKRKKEH